MAQLKLLHIWKDDSREQARIFVTSWCAYFCNILMLFLICSLGTIHDFAMDPYWEQQQQSRNPNWYREQILKNLNLLLIADTYSGRHPISCFSVESICIQLSSLPLSLCVELVIFVWNFI